jgi:hypothetical protein
VSLVACVLIGALVALVSGRISPFATRALLPLEALDEPEIYLTSLPDDPRRVLVTTQRSKSTFTRGVGQQAGVRYWIQGYGDPVRPGIPPRILLTSRSQGARLLVPAAAMDLERALCTGPEGTPEGLRVRLVNVFRDRLFSGTHLELRFPPRERDADGKWIDQALVCVRGNRVRTTDFLLQPSDILYREYLAAGRMPQGDFFANQRDELVFTLPESPDLPCTPLRVPLSLFDELALAHGRALPELLDDRWRIGTLPRVQESAPLPERVTSAARLLTVHLAARIEAKPERDDLARRVAGWTEGVLP